MKRFLPFHAVLLFFAVCFASFAEEKGRLSASDLAPGASDGFVFSNSATPDTQCDEGSGGDCCDGTLQETFAGVTKFTTSYCKGRYAGKASSTRYGIRFDTFHAFRSILNENQLVLVNSNAGCTSGDCCPTGGSKTYNWLLVRARPFDNYSSPMDMSLDTTYVGGTITYDHSQTVKWSGSSKFSLNALDAETKTNSSAYGARLFGTSTCSAGEFKASAVTDFTAANRPLGNYGYWLFGKNVAFYRQVSADPVIAVAFPRPAQSLSSSGVMASKNKQVFTGNYTGFTTRGVQVQRNVMLIPDVAGTTFTISEVADPSNPFSVSTLGTLACTNLDEPSQGFCRGTLTLTAVPGFSGKATCMMAYDIGNRDLVFCSAQNPSADSNHQRALVTIAAVSSHKSVLAMTASPVHLDANTSSGQMCATVENMTSRAVDTLTLTGNLSGDFSAVSLSGSVTAPFSGLTGSVSACGTSLPAFSKCKLCSNVTLTTQKVSAHALTLTFGDTPSSTKSMSDTAVATRGVSNLQYEVGKVTQNKTPSVKAVFANGTTQNIDAIKEKLQCSGVCTSATGTRSLAYTLEGLESAPAVGDVLVSTEEELCYNEEDDDNDGTTDCQDNDCDSERADISHTDILCNYNSERDCADSFDNDRDGNTDCDDGDCALACNVWETACNNSLDDDSDGNTDCADSDCNGQVNADFRYCGLETHSYGGCVLDGVDDDSDGYTDCADPDCYGGYVGWGPYGGTCDSGTETNCSDGYDFDGDGLTDANDPDCVVCLDSDGDTFGDGCSAGSDCDDNFSDASNNCSDNVVLDLRFDTDTSDSSNYHHAVGANGSPAISTSNAKFGGGSANFNGNGDRIDISSSTDFDLEDGDYTIEFWTFVRSVAGSDAARLFTLENNDEAWGIILANDGSNSLYVNHYGIGEGFEVSGALNGKLNQWVHLALVKNGTTRTLYIDGVAGGSTNSRVLPANAAQLSIGGSTIWYPYTQFDGLIDELKITKGYARYTTNFTPPTCASMSESDADSDGICNSADTESCSDSIDNNGNGQTDEECSSCNSSDSSSAICNQTGTCWNQSGCQCGVYDSVSYGQSCTMGGGGSTENCSDSLDNDSDASTDCQDADCDGVSGGSGICHNNSETCSDSFDNNGNGQTDENCYPCMDNDGDGYGYYCAIGEDCDDWANWINPGASEIWNGYDDNCNGQADEGLGNPFDWDGDGWLSYMGDWFDCNDADGSINPGASETCSDSVDNNCDGQTDENCYPCMDYDGDGYGYYCVPGEDCQWNMGEGNSAIHPGAADDQSDGTDNDCDGQIDEDYTVPCTDSDTDGVCSGSDCDDSNAIFSTDCSSNVVLDLHFNSDFSDSSGHNHNGTPNGNAEISSDVAKFGGGSAHFDGSSWLTVTASSALAVGTGDFTLEAWAYPTQVNDFSDLAAVLDTRPYGAGTGLLIWLDSASGKWVGYTSTNGNEDQLVISSPTTATLNAWTHLALVRSGTSLRFFVNGELAGTETLNANWNFTQDTTAPGFVGTAADAPGYFRNFYGYIDSVKITKGAALYTTTFTPATCASMSESDVDSDGICDSADTESCSDSIDNDGDSQTDEECSSCNSSDSSSAICNQTGTCWNQSGCQCGVFDSVSYGQSCTMGGGGSTENCSDSVDNDSDASTDCQDADCDGVSGGSGICHYSSETCSDSFDNNGNGQTDENCNSDVSGGDPYFDDVRVLVHADENITNHANGGTPTVTFVGGANYSTSDKKFGSASAQFSPQITQYCDGWWGCYDQLVVPNYLKINDTSRTIPANYTAEFWVKPDSDWSGAVSRRLYQRGVSDMGMYGIDVYYNNNRIYFSFYNSNYYYDGSGEGGCDQSGSTYGDVGTLSANTWYHVAIVREGSAIRIYFNGNRIGTGTLSANSYTYWGTIPSCTATEAITLSDWGNVNEGFGVSFDYGDNIYDNVTAKFDEIRISNRARYSDTSFTLPTSPYPNTKQAVAPEISISPSSYTLTAGTAMTAIVPSLTMGTIDSCVVSPSLPAGLSLNSSTCGISGTPTYGGGSQSYTITPSNSVGTGNSVTVSLTINGADAGGNYYTGGSLASGVVNNAAGLSVEFSNSNDFTSNFAITTPADGTATVTNGQLEFRNPNPDRLPGYHFKNPVSASAIEIKFTHPSLYPNWHCPTIAFSNGLGTFTVAYDPKYSDGGWCDANSIKTSFGSFPMGHLAGGQAHIIKLEVNTQTQTATLTIDGTSQTYTNAMFAQKLTNFEHVPNYSWYCGSYTTYIDYVRAYDYGCYSNGSADSSFNANGTGFCSGTYYIGGVAYAGLDSNGNGTSGGLLYSSGSLFTGMYSDWNCYVNGANTGGVVSGTGWCSADSVYYVSYSGTSLPSSGTGNYMGNYYSSGTLVGTTASISIMSQPSDQTASSGSATFSIGANITAPASLSYQWQKQESGTGSFSDISGATSDSLVLSNLTYSSDNGDVYQVVLSGTQGASSITSSSATLSVPVYAPDVPTSVSGAAGNAEVEVTWTAPSNNGGSAITDYVIQISSDSGSSWTTYSDSASTSTSASVTGLTNGTSYVFRVAAVNIGGTGDFSLASTSVSPSANAGDPYFSDVRVLVNADENITNHANGGTPTVTFVGGANYSTSDKKFGSASAQLSPQITQYCDGWGCYDQLVVPNYLKINDTSRTIPANYTAEFWVKPDSDWSGETSRMLYQGGVFDPGVSGLQLYHYNGRLYLSLNSYNYGYYSGQGDWSCNHSGYNYADVGTLSASTWHHIAIVREGNALRLYFNGNRVGNSTISASFESYDGSSPAGGCTASGAISLSSWGETKAVFGVESDYSDYVFSNVTAKFDEIRISNRARYSSATYTVPTAAFPKSAAPVSCNSETYAGDTCNQVGTCYSPTGCSCGIYSTISYGDTCSNPGQ